MMKNIELRLWASEPSIERQIQVPRVGRGGQPGPECGHGGNCRRGRHSGQLRADPGADLGHFRDAAGCPGPGQIFTALIRGGGKLET